MYKISVIIPVYNVEKYIAQCLNSVLCQNFDGCEIVVVNDGSQQNERAIIDDLMKKYSNIRYIEKENGGQGSARNMGLRLAQGKYILFLDSDDYLEEGTLAKLYETAEHTHSDIVLFDGYFVSEDKARIYYVSNPSYSQDVQKNYLLNASSPCFKLISRSLFADHQLYFPEGIIYEDLASVGSYMLFADKITYVKEALYNYLIRSGSTMKQLTYHKKLEDIFASLTHLKGLFVSQGVDADYAKELEYLYITHLLHDASLRFFAFPQGISQIDRIRSIMKEEYPHWRKNIYYKQKGKKYKIVCELFYRKQYGLLRKILK